MYDMTLEAVPLALLLASQVAEAAPHVPTDVWPYYAAIGSLSGAVVTLFGVIMKLTSNHSAEIARVHEENRKSVEERSRRYADEFKEKDQRLYDVSVKMAGIVERVESAISNLVEQLRGQR